MKSYIVSALLVCLGLASCGKQAPPETAAPLPKFSPPTYPMSREAFFQRFDPRLISLCDSPGTYNLDKEQCLAIVMKRKASCASSISVPNTIDDVEQLKALGRSYLECTSPGVFCNGVEVKTTEEAITHCNSD